MIWPLTPWKSPLTFGYCWNLEVSWSSQSVLMGFSMHSTNHFWEIPLKTDLGFSLSLVLNFWTSGISGGMILKRTIIIPVTTIPYKVRWPSTRLACRSSPWRPCWPSPSSPSTTKWRSGFGEHFHWGKWNDHGENDRNMWIWSMNNGKYVEK